MGRIASSSCMKPHERALSQLSIDERLHQLILATLGVSASFPEKASTLLHDQQLKIPENTLKPFLLADLINLPALDMRAEETTVLGTWERKDDALVIGAGSDYAIKLDEATQKIAPDWIGAENEIPVTILLPGKVQKERDDLIGSESCWRFITIRAQEKHDLFSDECMAPKDKANLAVRLYSTCKLLGLVGTQQPARNGSRICVDLLEAIGIADQLHYLCAKKLREWSKQQVQRSSLEDNQLNTLQNKRFKISVTSPKTDRECREKQAKQDEVERRIQEVRQQIADLETAYSVARITPDKNKAFYYAIPEATMDTLLPGKKSQLITGLPVMLTSSPKEMNLAFTTVCLGQPKEKDATALIRTAGQLRLMLAYLCPMTSGTAVTFRVPKRANMGRGRTTGITSPTLILPKAWAELAQGLKNYTRNTATKPMSDEDYQYQGNRADFVSAIYADYDTKQDELLRIIPTV